MAEIQLANHYGSIVFDDPVSSLDHRRRRKVARRLVEAASERQVIVFTHDVVFLAQLADETEKCSQRLTSWFVEPAGTFFGHTNNGLPWAHQGYAARIDSLEKTQKALEKLPWPAHPSEENAASIARQYSFLRATIERVVQDFVLNGTVRRFHDYINVKRLEGVVGFEHSEAAELFRLNQRCNDIVEAHDPASARNEDPPTPADLRKDIDDLKDLIETIKVRRKKANS